MKTTDQTILVTGASSGIGAVLSTSLAAAGNRVIACGRREEPLHDLSAKNDGIGYRLCDLQDNDAIRELAAELGPQIDILINCAGISQELSLTDQGGLDAQLKEVDINLNGVIRMVHAFQPHLTDRGETAIVNVSSALAFVPDAARPIYSATKAGLHAYTRALRHQLAGTDVRVFELMPPLTDTPMAENVTDVPKLSPEKLAEIFIRDLQRNTLEIAPGLSSTVRLLSRLAPAFLFRKLNYHR
ncbi:SDR family oxidoreductase [Jannaschia sp. CCS1]|uniref:SDR family oxidoreductase n=1 Tax=Jannaschia sp. (strain CCS1) TaxID=290400 RepID=UPI0002FCBF7D|nr:SDR family NAD(P)-dependent oxidoreductase [Jannaschia sp. CCS1]